MPTYDYVCSACKKSFEIFHSMTESPRRKCPACGKSALERQLGTGGAIIFKGSGFYQTDYRSASYKKAAEADAKPAGGAETKPADAAASASKPTESSKPAEAKPAKAETKKKTKASPGKDR